VKSTRRELLRLLGIGTAAGLATPTLDKLDFLIRQPTSIIKPEDNIALVRFVPFTVHGVNPGTRIYVANAITQEEIINEVVPAGKSMVTQQLAYSKNIPVTVRYRKAGFLSFHAQAEINEDGLEFHVVQIEDRVCV
jgi:hypothetical protein